MIEKSALKIDAKSLSDLNDMIERAKNTHIANGWLLVNVSRTVIDGYSAVVQLIRKVEDRKETFDDADARLEFVAAAMWRQDAAHSNVWSASSCRTVEAFREEDMNAREKWMSLAVSAINAMIDFDGGKNA